MAKFKDLVVASINDPKNTCPVYRYTMRGPEDWKNYAYILQTVVHHVLNRHRTGFWKLTEGEVVLHKTVGEQRRP